MKIETHSRTLFVKKEYIIDIEQNFSIINLYESYTKIKNF